MDYIYDGGTSKNGLLFEKAFGTKEGAEQKYCYLPKNNLKSQLTMELNDKREQLSTFNCGRSLNVSYFTPVSSGHGTVASMNSSRTEFISPSTPEAKPAGGTMRRGGNDDEMSIPENGGKRRWRKFTCALTISLITGIVTILLVHFLAELYDISKLVLIFTLITTFLMVLLNMRNLIGLCVGFYEFLASLNGQIFILIWIIVLLLIGPVSEKVNDDERTSNSQLEERNEVRFGTARRIPNNNSTSGNSVDTVATSPIAAIDVQALLDQLKKNQSSVTHKVSQSLHQMQASMLKHLKMAKDTTVEQCEREVESISAKVHLADESSMCGKSAAEISETEAKENAKSVLTTPVARQTTNNDPISRIISMGTADIEAQRPSAKFQPLSKEPTNTRVCACCSQHLATLEKFCLVNNEMSDNWTVNILADSQTTEEVLSRIIFQYFDITQLETVKPFAVKQDMPIQDPPIVSNVSSEFESLPVISNSCDLVHYIAASFAGLAVSILVWHYFEISFLTNKKFNVDNFDNSSVCKKFAPVIILLLLSTQINIIMTFLKLSGKLGFPETPCFNSLCFSWTLGCLMASWVLMGISYCAIALKMTSLLLKRRQSRKLALLMAQVTEPKGKGDNLLNLNVINNPIGLNNNSNTLKATRIEDGQTLYRKPVPEPIKSSRV